MSLKSRSRGYGKAFDHWLITDYLGSGSRGKSVVFKLVHMDTNSSFKSALKVISLIEQEGDYNRRSDARKNSYQQEKERCKTVGANEVSLMYELQGHTNIVSYFDHTFVDWSDEDGFGCDMMIRMELLLDLRRKIDAGHTFSESEALKIGRDICTALVLCHKKNILHRDIKPENIFYNNAGNYKLGDFGISRIISASPMSKASTIVCTPEYAAPEQLSGSYDFRVDIYSLGLVLYELANGNILPFASSSFVSEDEVRLRVSGNVPLPAPQYASKEFATVILKACAHRPEDRYQSAEAFLHALNEVHNVCEAPVVWPKANANQIAADDAAECGESAKGPGVDRNATQPAHGVPVHVSNHGRETLPAGPKVSATQTAKGDAALRGRTEQGTEAERNTMQSAVGVSGTAERISNPYATQYAGRTAGSSHGNETRRSVQYGQKRKRQTSIDITKAVLVALVVIVLLLSLKFCIGNVPEPSEPAGAMSETTGDTQLQEQPSDQISAPAEDTVPTPSSEPAEDIAPKPSSEADADKEPETPSKTEKPDATVPPATNPPATDPPATDPPTTQPPKIVLTGIRIKSEPSKKTYLVGDKLDTNGLILEASYSDGSGKRISSGFSCSPSTLNKAGKQTIQVSYQGMTATFSVTVENLWSDWVTELPAGVTSSTYEIQEKTQYASSKITEWRAIVDGMPPMTGWQGFYDRTEYETKDSGWSDWQVEGEGGISDFIGALHPYAYSYEEMREDDIQYRTRTRIDSSSEYGAWSDWQFDEITETDNCQVETREVYRERVIVVYKIDYYYKVEAGRWLFPVYGDTPIQKDENTAVRTRTVYRYRERVS